MSIKSLLAVFLIFALLTMPAMAANNDEEDHVRVLDPDGNDKTEGNHVNVDDDDEDNNGNTVSKSKSSNNDDDDDEESDDVGDVWGIKQSDAGWDTLVDINTLGSVYMGFTPFKNMSILSIAISGGLALTFVVVGIFGLLMLAGVGAAHPNVKKGWDLIRGAQGKIMAIGIVFAFAFFMIILVFFTLSIFGKVIVLMA